MEKTNLWNKEFIDLTVKDHVKMTLVGTALAVVPFWILAVIAERRAFRDLNQDFAEDTNSEQ